MIARDDYSREKWVGMTQMYRPDWREDEPIAHGPNALFELQKRCDNQAATIKSLTTQVSKLRSWIEASGVPANVVDAVLSEE